MIPDPPSEPGGLADAVAAALLALLVVLRFALGFPLILPEEDAAILLRYAAHLGDGHGIVWNRGEPPVDGATDFLFMAVVAGLYRAGLGLEQAARWIGVVSHALTVVLVHVAVRRQAGRGAALLAAAFLAVGPALHHAAACFGTPLFALCVAAAWHLAQRLMKGAGSARTPFCFALAGLAAGLVRPEGVLLAALMLAAVVFQRRGVGSARVLGAFAAVFLTLGLAYFLWRWSYFGHPLPNPFYKKGGGVLHWPTLQKSFANLWRLAWPFLGVTLAGLLPARTRRDAAASLIPVVGFASVWVLLSDETNYLMRFRYPLLPVVLLSWAPIWSALRDGAAARLGPRGRRALAYSAVAAGVGLVGYQHARFPPPVAVRSGLHETARALAGFRNRDYTIAVTEAGLLPLYSGWRSVDAWGLNDAWIARHGVITPEYLERKRPDVIMFHAYYSPEVERGRGEGKGLGPGWHRMVVTLHDHAEAHGFELAAVFGRHPYETHYYYVRRGLPGGAALVDVIRGQEYPWYRDGEPSLNFAPAAASRAAAEAAEPRPQASEPARFPEN
jgi:hypothetical protein